MKTISKNDNYIKGDYTLTDLLNKNEIIVLLKDYKRCKNIKDLPIGTHIRYFIKTDNEWKFRIGGDLLNNADDRYIVLNSGIKKWCVQLNNSKIYYKMNPDELELYNNKIIKKQQKYINDLSENIYKKLNNKPHINILNHNILTDIVIHKIRNGLDIEYYNIETKEMRTGEKVDSILYKNKLIYLELIDNTNTKISIDINKYLFYKKNNNYDIKKINNFLNNYL